jgi:phage shock protein C
VRYLHNRINQTSRQKGKIINHTRFQHGTRVYFLSNFLHCCRFARWVYISDMQQTKKLYKSAKDSMILGVVGGIGEYFDVDPTILRLAFVVITLITGVFPCVVAYILAYFIIPNKPKDSQQAVDTINDPKDFVSGNDTKTSGSDKTEKTFTSPDLHKENRSADLKTTLPELAGIDIKNVEKERYAPGERKVEEYSSELAVPAESKIESQNEEIESKNDLKATLDSILKNNRDTDINDLID